MAERLLLSLVLVALGAAVYALFRRAHLRRASQATTAAGKPVVLYFRSDSCIPCRSQAVYLEQVRAALSDQIIVEKIDADVEHERSAAYGIFTLPTTLIVDAAGTVRHANYGLADARKLTGQLHTLGVMAAG